MIKLQASSRLQLTAAKGDAQPLREALLETADLFANAVEFIQADQVRQAVAEMKQACRLVSKAAKKTFGKTVTEIEPTVSQEESDTGKPALMGGVQIELKSPASGKLFQISWEFNICEALPSEASAWVSFDGGFAQYEFKVAKGCSVDKYKAVMNRIMNQFEAKGFIL